MSEFGRLIVFEGPDGVGKTTLARRLVDYLTAKQIPCEYLAFPGRMPGTLGCHVYQLHHDPARFDVPTISPTSLQLLHVAAHLDALERQILPMLRVGRWVVLDRFWWSTWVYGLVSGAARRTLELMVQLEQEHWGLIKPAVVFLISRPTPLNRDEPMEQWSQLCSLYTDLAQKQAGLYLVQVVNNASSVDEALKPIINAIAQWKGGTPIAPPERYLGHTGSTQQPEQGPPLIDSSPAASAPVSQTTLPVIYSRLSPVVPTPVFDTYWHFAAERQAIFFRRLAGALPPWTQDPVLARYKFTNAYRASDRVSQYLIQHIIYQGDQTPVEVFFRILLFKIFNRIETWELLLKEVGPITYESFSCERYDTILTGALAAGISIFSGAYIMPAGRGRFTSPQKHRTYLRLLEMMIQDEVPLRIQEARSMQQVFELLHSYPLLGDFLAYQYAIDINYSKLTSFSEMEFVVPGPGAKSGIRKCFRNLGGLTEAEIIRVVTERQEDEFARLGLHFESLWGRRLQLVDCQNLFCEVDKYARIAHPDVAGTGGRSQIKQKYRPNARPIKYWYPPKWGINHRIEGGQNSLVPSV